jgi:hypothetical protein
MVSYLRYIIFLFAFGILPFSTFANSASGTGFFVSADGYIVTNNHVINNAKKILVTTSYGASHEAQVVKRDVNNDLVILKISGKNYPFINISSSSEVQRGEKVYTLGFPQIGIQGSAPKLTDGVISSLSGLGDEPTTFQITNPIQPGNSGGPLFTEDGDVIGVIVSTLDALAVAKATGNLPQNVNYAIKSNYLIELLRTIQPDKFTNPKKPKGVFTQTKKLTETVKRIEQSVVIVSVELEPKKLSSNSKSSPPPKTNPPPNAPADKNRTLATLDECKSLLPAMKKNYPEKLDEITTLVDSDCMVHKGRTTLVYQYVLDISVSDKAKEIMKSGDAQTKKKVCSNKEVKNLLDYVDVFYYYVDKNGSDVHGILNKKSQCN